MTYLKIAKQIADDIQKRSKQASDYVNSMQIEIVSDSFPNLLYKLQNGQPDRNIPPRPVVSIGTESEEAQEIIQRAWGQAFEKAFLGDKAGAKRIVQDAADEIADIVRGVFGSSELQPNAQSTIAKKGFNAPGVQTGQLRDSIIGRVNGG